MDHKKDRLISRGEMRIQARTNAQREQFSGEVIGLMEEYYTHYYKDLLSLKDYEERIKNRLREEEDEDGRLRRLAYILNYNFGEGQRHLVVGAGTGGLSVELHRRGCLVFGVEPNPKAFEILVRKADESGFNRGNFSMSKAESMPFDSDFFDFVHCFTVLEHVDDVEKTLDEMIRVTKPGGRVYIMTPDYRFPYEGHYKMLFPTFLPKWLGRAYLEILGRKSGYLQGINYVNEKSINRTLGSRDLIWYRILTPLSSADGGNRSLATRIYRFFVVNLNIRNNQEIVIIKSRGLK